jgi:uncharacterized protein (DUF58 family)
VDEYVSIKVSLRNAKRVFPSFSISVEDSGRRQPAGSSRNIRHFTRRAKSVPAAPIADRAILRHAAYFPVLRPRETRSMLVGQSFPSRGRYELDGFRLSTRFPFGFFRRSERIRAEGEVLVYPRIAEVSDYFHLLPFLPGHLEGRHVGHGESLYALRKYREGESARRVDWKATAKTSQLMAREYAREEESKFCLILDNRAAAARSASLAGQFEKAVCLAASLAAHFTDEGAELEYFTPDEYVQRGMGTEQLYRILRSLAVIACQEEPAGTTSNLREQLAAIVDAPVLERTLSEKVFKVIITSKTRGSFSSSMWRSSHIVYFDEL